MRAKIWVSLFEHNLYMYASNPFDLSWVVSFLAIDGQESPGWISVFKLVTFFVVENIKKPKCLVKYIGQWIPDNERLGIASDIKKKIIFETLQKNGYKVWTIYKVGTLLYISAF